MIDLCAWSYHKSFSCHCCCLQVDKRNKTNTINSNERSFITIHDEQVEEEKNFTLLESPDMDKYTIVNHGLMARVQPKFKVAIGRWTSKRGVQGYKTYAMIICMFMPKFLDGLSQPLGNNPWPTLLTNRNYMTCFFKQCYYLEGIPSGCGFFITSEVCQNWPNVKN